MKKILISLLLSFTLIAHADDFGKFSVKSKLVEISIPADALLESGEQAVVSAQITGRILEVKADAGQSVKKGDLLMRIDGREADEASRGAEATYINSKLNFERTQDLVSRKFMSQAALDKAKADFDAASANRSATGASQSHSRIVSPITGIVARRHADAGDMATPGKPLFTIYQPSNLRAVASIPQSRLKDIRGTKKAKVEFPELGKWVDGLNVNLLPTTDVQTHAAQVRVSLPPMVDVTPGMFARVHFITGQAEKLTIPVSAVLRRGEVAAVYIQAPDNRLILRQLRLGDLVGQGEVEVLAGLAIGDVVITDPVKAAIRLKSGK
jgi:RND family efflux transporter MFP subunit